MNTLKKNRVQLSIRHSIGQFKTTFSANHLTVSSKTQPNTTKYG